MQTVGIGSAGRRYTGVRNLSLTDNIGCCGMDCGACEARKATAANDTEALARIASSLESEDENPFILPSKVKCTGCLVPGVKSLSCCECRIRQCAMKTTYLTADSAKNFHANSEARNGKPYRNINTI